MTYLVCLKEGGEQVSWRVPKKNKNPTIRIWGSVLSNYIRLDENILNEMLCDY